MNNIGVIGAGTMGNGIAHVSALAGFHTILMDIKDEYVNHAMSRISKNLERQVKKEIISQSDMYATIDKIKTTTNYKSLSDCNLVIEAAIENLEIKLDIFRNLDKICKKDAILASNTSSISITKIAAEISQPERVIGMHFMNPVPIMKLVEVIRGYLTDDNTTNTVLEITKKMKKIPVECNDSPGFVSNRILAPMLNEAIFCLMEGVGTREAIDEIMKLGMAHPMGPLTLADLIGLDVCLNILEVLQRDLGDDKYRPCPLLRKMVTAGHLGHKTGRGFYEYNSK